MNSEVTGKGASRPTRSDSVGTMESSLRTQCLTGFVVCFNSLHEHRQNSRIIFEWLIHLPVRTLDTSTSLLCLSRWLVCWTHPSVTILFMYHCMILIPKSLMFYITSYLWDNLRRSLQEQRALRLNLRVLDPSIGASDCCSVERMCFKVPLGMVHFKHLTVWCS